MLKPELYALCKQHRKTPKYLCDEEARKRGHIVLRLPPYHCQYNPIELVWGLMKRDYDKNILEYGEFSEEKALKKWTDAINRITPAIWKKVVQKVDKLIVNNWEKECIDKNCDATDYACLIINPNDDSSDSEFGDEYDEEEDEDVIAFGDMKKPPNVKEDVHSPPASKSDTNHPQSQGARRSLSFQANKDFSVTKGNLVQSEVIDLEALDELWSSKLHSDVTDDDKVVAKGFGYTIKNHDLVTLNGSGYLNDQIINVYFKMIDTVGDNVYSFSTFFYEKLMQSSYHGVRGFTKKLNIFEKAHLLIPLHLKTSHHWALIHVSMNEMTIRYCDSILQRGLDYLRNVLDYLEMEAQAKDITFDRNKWKFASVKDIPQQRNGYDCGVFVCQYALSIALGKKPAFNQDHIPQIRESMKDAVLRMDIGCHVADEARKRPGVILDSQPQKRPRVSKATKGVKTEKPLKMPSFRKPTEENKPTSTPGVRLLTSSHVSIRSSQFSAWNGDQSIVITACAITAHLQGENICSSKVMDHILFNGHNEFLRLKQMGYQGSEEPAQVQWGSKSYNLSYVTLAEGKYSVNRSEIIASVVSKDLLNVSNTCNYAYMLVGHLRSFAFWSLSNRLQFFTCHCVDANNVLSTSILKGAARLFECMSPQCLSQICFRNDIFDTDNWKLLKVSAS